MRIFLSLFAIASLSLAGCSDGGGGSDGPATLEFGGKADNFYSDVAVEVEVSGTVPLELTAAEIADEATRDDYVARRLTAVGLYLTTFMTAKFRGIDIDNDGEIGDDEVFFHNEGYGGFQAMVRNHTVETISVDGEMEGEYVAAFTIDMAGPRDLLDNLSRLEGAEVSGQAVAFDLIMPKGETVDPEGVPRREIRNFDPADHMGELETIRVEARPLPEPSDAYPQYAAFVADGVYDITMFFGHDYNTPRSDLQEAEETFHYLEGAGFDMPVSSFADLAADSGPFIKEIRANGQGVTLEVRIFHSDMFTTARTEQHDLAISELIARDVFFYNGHAGPYYGFYLDAADAATVGYLELRDVPFDASRQQLFIAQGCQTYSQYADMLYANPAKSEDNLDVIVTVNYSYGRGTLELFRSLIATDANGDHDPQRFYAIVGELNREWVNSYYDVFYGVTGIDGNPVRHPYANPDAQGDACMIDADCGDPKGNVCVAVEGTNSCAFYSLGADGCRDGDLYGVFDRDGRTYGACYAPPADPEMPEPTTPQAPQYGDLVITEIMANPNWSLDYDGEWFEMVSLAPVPVNLKGCTLGDDDGIHHTIETDVFVDPGQYVVLARSGTSDIDYDYDYGDGYALANRGDEIELRCNDAMVERVAWSGGVRAGYAFSLDPMSTDPAANDDMDAFCYAVDNYTGGYEWYSDHGSPGMANPACE